MANSADILEVGARINLDEWSDSASTIISDAQALDSLSDIEISASVDIGDTSVLDDLASYDGSAIDVSITPEITDETPLTELNDLDSELITPEIDTQQTDEGKATVTALTALAALGAIQLAITIVGNILDVIRSIESFTLDPLLSLDDAVARVNAQTGNAIPNAKELISGIFYDDLGDSIEQVAKLVTQAKQLGAPVEAATRAALTFTHTFSDQDPTQVLNTMNQLVATGLVPNFSAAADLLVGGFQEGNNRAGDLLVTLGNNASTIRDLGLNGQQAMSLIKTGLDGGYASANDVLNSLVKIKQNIIGAAGNPSSDVNTLLRQLSIPNPIESGEGWSADFLNSVITTIQNAPVDDATRQQMFSTLVGGKIGTKEYSAFMNLSAADPVFDQLTGKAATAATEVDNSLSGAIGDFAKEAQKAAADFLSSDQIDLPGKLALLKTGLQDALNVLQSGGTLGTALEVGLKPIGLDDFIRRLEQAVNNLVIGVLQAVAVIQDITGHGEQAAATRQTVSGLSQGALITDLKIDTGSADQIVKDVNLAFSRGLDPTKFGDVLQQAVSDLVASGDFKKAQDLLDASQKLQFTTMPGVDVEKTNLNIEQGQAAAQRAIDNAKALSVKQVSSSTAGDIVTGATEFTDAITDTKDATKDATQAVDVATQSRQKETDAAKDYTTAADLLTVSQQQVNEETQGLNTNVGTLTTTLSDTNDKTMSLVGGLNVLQGSLQAVIDKANAMAAATGGGGTTNNNQQQIVTQNNHIQNNAQGAQSLNRLLSAVRGFPS